MSDDDDNTDPPEGFFVPIGGFPFGNSEEAQKLRERIEEERARHQLRSLDWSNRFNSLFEETLLPEDLVVLRNLFNQTESQTGYYIVGIIDTILRLKHADSCSTCGRNDCSHSVMGSLLRGDPNGEAQPEG